jgi:hypothetical protein
VGSSGKLWQQVNAKEGLGVRSSGTSVTVGRVIARTMAMRVLFYQMNSVLDGGFDGWDHSFTAEGVEGEVREKRASLVVAKLTFRES